MAEEVHATSNPIEVVRLTFEVGKIEPGKFLKMNEIFPIVVALRAQSEESWLSVLGPEFVRSMET